MEQGGAAAVEHVADGDLDMPETKGPASGAESKASRSSASSAAAAESKDDASLYSGKRYIRLIVEYQGTIASRTRCTSISCLTSARGARRHELRRLAAAGGSLRLAHAARRSGGRRAQGTRRQSVSLGPLLLNRCASCVGFLVVSQLTGERKRVFGCSRTDGGVHAKGQVASFFTNYAGELFAFLFRANAKLLRCVLSGVNWFPRCGVFVVVVE